MGRGKGDEGRCEDEGGRKNEGREERLTIDAAESWRGTGQRKVQEKQCGDDDKQDGQTAEEIGSRAE